MSSPWHCTHRCAQKHPRQQLFSIHRNKKTYEFENTILGGVGSVVVTSKPVVDVLAETLRVGAGLVADFSTGEVTTDEAE